MTAVIVRDFPADELPNRLRNKFEPGARVDITLTRSEQASSSERLSLVELLTGGPTVFKDDAEIAAHMDELRGPRSDV